MKDIDAEIEAYRKQLRAEGKLAESDLDELEDHLRELTNDLRTAGLSAAEAVTEAARRLGDPRQLAREHARVRSLFGAPLSFGRALSGAVLFLMPFIQFYVREYGDLEFSWSACLPLAAYVFVASALVARRTWARAVVLGVTMHMVTIKLLLPDAAYPLNGIVDLGLLAVVMPWRRNELSLAGITLALQAWAFQSSLWAFSGAVMDPSGPQLLRTVCGTIALVSAAAACIAIVRRARWSAIASAVSALALFSALYALSLWMFSPDDPKFQLFQFGGVGSGFVAAIVAAFLGWFTTRSLVGPLRRAMP